MNLSTYELIVKPNQTGSVSVTDYQGVVSASVDQGEGLSILLIKSDDKYTIKIQGSVEGSYIVNVQDVIDGEVKDSQNITVVIASSAITSQTVFKRQEELAEYIVSITNDLATVKAMVTGTLVASAASTASSLASLTLLISKLKKSQYEKNSVTVQGSRGC